MNTTNQPCREIKNYEYRVRTTPEYTAPIEEGWEVVDVFIKTLGEVHITYAIVFRKLIPTLIPKDTDTNK